MNRQQHHDNDGGGEVDYEKFSGFAAHARTYGVCINVNEIADRWMKRSEYGTTSFVFLNIINSSAPAIKKKLPLIRIGYYVKGETMVPPLSLPLIEQL